MMTYNLKIQITLVLLLTFSFSIKGQNLTIDSTRNFHLGLAPTYSYLYSTHGTKYRGFGINVETSLSNRSQVGLGIERIYCPYHYDNGLNLSNLHLVPIYAMIRYNIFISRWLQPYFKVAIGVTFMGYEEQKAHTAEVVVKRSTTGVYNYGGLGTTIVLKKGIDFFIDMGMVGYKMSWNALDINPHGVAGKTGLLFTL